MVDRLLPGEQSKEIEPGTNRNLSIWTHWV
jgi:hypothetical protein